MLLPNIMGIEQIPAMQVAKCTPFVDSLVEPESLVCFEGKFVSLRGADRLFVYAQRDSSEHMYVFQGFMTRAKSVYGCRDEIESFEEPLGGGFLVINDREIVFTGESQAFGKYVRENVEPLAIQWQKQYLPNHSLVFE